MIFYSDKVTGIYWVEINELIFSTHALHNRHDRLVTPSSFSTSFATEITFDLNMHSNMNIFPVDFGNIKDLYESDELTLFQKEGPSKHSL